MDASGDHPAQPPAPVGMPELNARRLDGKVAVVTGAGSVPSDGFGVGNGGAIAVLFAQHGARVVLCDVDGDAARRTAEMIRRIGGVGLACQADVTSGTDCEELVSRAVHDFGGIDVLVNNVGIAGPSQTVVDVSEEDWDRVMAVNLKSMMLTCKYAIPAFKPGSAIVNVASIGALRWTERTAYAASKGGVLSLTTALAGQHAAQGIRANCVVPGAVWTASGEAAVLAMTGDPQAVEQIRRQRSRNNLLGEGTAWDVANAALYLASDDSRWVTGHALVVDGGACTQRAVANANVIADSATEGRA